MANELEKAQIMYKLARKNNWGAKYDRTEHFKRFPHLESCIYELRDINWLILHKKAQFTGISLNTAHKSEIIAFIEKHLPHLQGSLQ